MPRVFSKESFIFHNTEVLQGDLVDWFVVSPPNEDSFIRLRNISTGAEMKLSNEELLLIERIILGYVSASDLTGTAQA